MLVCKLNKVLYRLKQASRAWIEGLKSFLLKTLCFSISLADSCLFVNKSTSGTIFILVYVNDIVIIESDLP